MHLSHNITDIQSLKSDSCGWYCIGLLMYLNQSSGNIYERTETYIKNFDLTNSDRNDNVLKGLFRQMIGNKMHPLMKKYLNA
jgi:hypothetical protein